MTHPSPSRDSARDSARDWLSLPIAGVGCLGVLAYAIVSLAASFAFLEDHWNWHWFFAVLAVGLALMAFPGALVVTTFFGAWLVWEWHFLAALALAAPGLVFAVAVLVLGGTVSVFQQLFGRR